MSTYLAVGGVTAVLRSMLSNALTNGGPSSILASIPGITANSPDLVPTGADEPARLNLFMYYASLNPALRNEGLPSRNSQGTALSNPPLAVNLHYLISAYGSTQLDPEILLGWAMKVFHDTPVVPRLTIQNALDALNGTSTEGTLIADSSLANQIEHLRITPETLTTEEIYRLWSAFQTHYRPTTSYQVSVVVIQDTTPFASSLPVRKRTVTVMPLQGPVVDTLSPGMLTAGATITVKGSNFLGNGGDATLVSFDNGAAVTPSMVQGTVLKVVLPNILQAGTRSLRVVRTITYPDSPTPHTGFTSSPTPFQLLPSITSPAPLTVAQGGTLTLTVSPAVGSAQQAVLYVGDSAIPIDERAATGPASSTTLDFPIPSDFHTGTYPLRVEIDAAQSKLTPDTTSGSPTFGQLLPQLQVTA